MKATICPHGNKDKRNDGVRKDSATAQFDAIIIMLEIATFLPVRLGFIYKSGHICKTGR